MHDRWTVAIIGLVALVGGCIGGVARAEQAHMQEALNHLNHARASLEQAKADKGGHREKALDHVIKAIDEVQKGIEFAREH